MASNDPNHWKVVRDLSREARGGGNCGILVVQNRRSGAVAVEKKIPRNILRTHLAKRERDILRELDHKNVVRLLSYCFDPGMSYGSLFLEHCDGGALDDLIHRYRNSGRPFSENNIWLMFKEMAKGLEYIHWGSSHSISILHLDLKPGNVVIKSDRHSPLGFVLKLADFGFSQIAPRGRRAQKHEGGTPAFEAPEVWTHPSDRCDVFSLGVIITCMLKLETNPSRHGRGFYRDLGRRHTAAEYSQDLLTLLYKCMDPDPHNRPDSANLVPMIRHLA